MYFSWMAGKTKSNCRGSREERMPVWKEKAVCGNDTLYCTGVISDFIVEIIGDFDGYLVWMEG